MRAMQIIEWGKPLELREYPTPEPEGKEVLVRVTACGVCHSDLHIWSGQFDLGDGEVPVSPSGVDLAEILQQAADDEPGSPTSLLENPR